MSKDNKLFNVFHNTIEALEEYIEKIDYPGFKKQIFDKSINSPNRSPEDLAADFLCQLYILKAMIKTTRKKPEYSHEEVQKIFYQWIDAARIKADNCPKDLKHYLFTINEVLENRGENFVKQTDEKNNSGKEPDPKDVQELFNRWRQELNNPSEKKEVDIQGKAKTGKEIFQQIVNSLPDSDRQNFRFYIHDKTENSNQRLSWSAKIAIGGASSIVVLGILILLKIKIEKKGKIDKLGQKKKKKKKKNLIFTTLSLK